MEERKGKPLGANNMWQRLERALEDHQDLICANASGTLAAMTLRYVASVPHLVYDHVPLALLAVLEILAAFLLIAQSKVQAKAANVIGAAVVAGICFAVVSYVV